MLFCNTLVALVVSLSIICGIFVIELSHFLLWNKIMKYSYITTLSKCMVWKTVDVKL